MIIFNTMGLCCIEFLNCGIYKFSKAEMCKLVLKKYVYSMDLPIKFTFTFYNSIHSVQHLMELHLNLFLAILFHIGPLFCLLRRMSYRKQKRWWNAYILMYERMDSEMSTSDKITKSLQDLTIGTLLICKLK